jgi:hypothetical protein
MKDVVSNLSELINYTKQNNTANNLSFINY